MEQGVCEEFSLQGSVHLFRLSVDRAERLFGEVDRAAKRLEDLSEKRREHLRELARMRALEDETSQVSSLTYFLHVTYRAQFLRKSWTSQMSTRIGIDTRTPV